MYTLRAKPSPYNVDVRVPFTELYLCSMTMTDPCLTMYLYRTYCILVFTADRRLICECQVVFHRNRQNKAQLRAALLSFSVC
jgi:hypothetical protein